MPVKPTEQQPTQPTQPPQQQKPRKLHGRAFYESIGSPTVVLAPMVDQSEFVCSIPHLFSPPLFLPLLARYLSFFFFYLLLFISWEWRTGRREGKANCFLRTPF